MTASKVTRRLARSWLLVLAGCSRTSCSSEPSPAARPTDLEDLGRSPKASATEPASPEAGARIADEAATVTLLDPGHPPRRLFRYAWRVGRRESLTMDLRTEASTETRDARAPGVGLPPVRIVVAIDPTEVTAGGDLRYAWRITSAAVLAEADTPNQLAEGMRREVAVVEHLTGTGVTSASGLAESMTVDPTSIGTKSGTGEMVEQVTQTLRNAAAPFPESEIGLGARWQKIDRLPAKDSSITQSDTFALTASHGTTGTLDDALAQTAPPQPLPNAGAPPGAPPRAQMESMLVAGTAKTTFDLTRLVPDTRIDSTTTMIVSGRGHGEPAERTTMILHVDVDIHGKVE